MAFRLMGKDHQLLACIAEHRVLNVIQISALCQRNARATHRRLGVLEGADLVRTRTSVFRRDRGRPETLLSLTERGVELLRSDGTLPRDMPHERVAADGIAHQEHELLLNWFRVHLLWMERMIAPLSVQFLSAQSPFLMRGADRQSLILDSAPAAEEDGRAVTFIPDGVFCLVHRQLEKALLFFLEVDMGTESRASTKPNRPSVQQKIRNYQAYFRCGRYKRYESHWNCSFRGFRLLVLCNSAGRLGSLCPLVRQMPPSDFIWLTDQGRLEDLGAGAAIWARGGRLKEPLESILGSQMPEPLPPPPLTH